MNKRTFYGESANNMRVGGKPLKTKIELNKDDMRKIIAENFSVSEDKVTVSTRNESVGYLMDEHTEEVPYCIVEKSD